MNVKKLESEKLKKLQRPVSTLKLNKRTRNCLLAVKVEYIYELVQLSEWDLMSIKNFGNNSLTDIRGALAGLGLTLNMEINFTDDFENIISCPDPVIPLKLKEISLTRFGFTSRTYNSLIREEIFNAFDLVSTPKQEIEKIRSLGKNSLAEINKVVMALRHGVISPQEFSMRKFVEHSNFINFLPKRYNEDTPETFISSIPIFFDEFCDTLNKLENHIAKQRIWPINAKTSTLEEIGELHNITRERVRQVEKKIIRRLAELLCENVAVKCKLNTQKYICNIDFASNWILAANTFADIRETNVYLFAKTLSDIWKVKMEDLIPVLPFAIVVFTRSTTTMLSRGLKDDSPVKIPLVNTSPRTKSIKLSSFRIGKHSKVLSQAGYTTVEDVQQHWPMKKTSASKNTIDRLISAEQYVDSFGELDWRRYGSHLNLKYAPMRPPKNPSDFFLHLNEFISFSLPHLTSWKHCRDVFDQRTQFPANRRKTLTECARDILGKPNFGPHIARIEKYLLEKVSKVLVLRDFSEAQIWVPEEILSYISECRELYEIADTSYQTFCTLLVNHFSLSKLEILLCSSVLWGLFNGLPPERYYYVKNRKIPELSIEPLKRNKIKLVGFRTVH